MKHSAKRKKLLHIEELDPPNDTMIQILDGAFNRKYTYTMPQSDPWTIPERLFVDSCWTDSSLQLVKSSLNTTKGQLDNIDIEQWQSHTKRTNLAAEIMKYVRTKVNPELGTQAWFKFHEILGSFPSLIPNTDEHFQTVHLCEAPGAFVASLNHYLVSRELHSNWDWLASTLNPYYEGNDPGAMIDNDQFILGTRTKWYFGADETGDIMNIENCEHLKQTCVDRGLNNICLVTCDGSIDCANDPGDQEKMVVHLVFCELVTALTLLCQSGSLVLKMFTLFEDASISIVFLLCCLFKKVNVFKPLTSKSGNSEVYVVALEYQAADMTLLSQLKKFIGPVSPSCPMFGREMIPKSFLKQHYECCKRFYNWQINTIESNLQLFDGENCNLPNETKALQLHCAKVYVERFKVKPVNEAACLVTKEKRLPVKMLQQHHNSHVKRRHHGTLVARQQKIQQPLCEKIFSRQELNNEHTSEILSYLGKPVLPHDAAISEWNPAFGRIFSVLRSSKFCQREYLLPYLELLADTKNMVSFEDDYPMDVLHITFLDYCQQTASLYRVIHKKLDRQVIFCHKDETDTVMEILASIGMNTEFLCCSVTDLQTFPSASVFCSRLQKLPQPDMERITGDKDEISDFIDILKVISEGCHCLISAGPLLTRLRAGIMFVMYACFKKVTLYKTGSSCTVCIIGWEFLGCPTALRSYLFRIHDLLEQAGGTDNYQKDQGLLEFIPIEHLYDDDFYDIISEINCDFTQRRYNYLLRKQKQLYSTAFNKDDEQCGK